MQRLCIMLLRMLFQVGYDSEKTKKLLMVYLLFTIYNLEAE